MKKSIIFSTLLLLSTITIFAQKSDKPLIYSNKSGAIKGFDPVAYFLQSQPIKGTKEITYVWHEATWHFVNIENKALFVANPEKYAPQYGGYCAYGLAKGYKVKIEPDAWAIENGKLYLNYDQSVQKDWNKDRKDYIQQADKAWNRK